MKRTIPIFILLALCFWVLHSYNKTQDSYDHAASEMDSIVNRQTETERKAAKKTCDVETAPQQPLETPSYKPARGGQIIKHKGFTLSYDADYKTPQWVAWELTAAETDGNEQRRNNFQPDPDIKGAKAYHADYTRSGYDRGHMAPAGDMKWDAQAMEESFYMSNVCPQNHNLNKGDWKELEELERTWAKEYGAVCITAGPIYKEKNPKRIGSNKIAVPDAFFKVLLTDYPKDPKAYGFIFANKAGSHPLTYYQLTVDEVERQTGMDFFPTLPDELENKIEAETPEI